ncbi:30S ribosomal protein S10 [Treponema sp. R6D11]
MPTKTNKKNIMRIKVLGYDLATLESAVKKLVKIAESTGADLKGPTPLPVKKEIFTILRSVHVNKDSREQFERRTYKRLIDIVNPTQKTIETLTMLDMPAGIEVQIKNIAA